MLFDRKGASERLFLRPWIGPYVAKSQGWRCDEQPPKMTKKASTLYLCFIASLFAFNSEAWSAPTCPETDYNETARIKHIVDGEDRKSVV